MVLLYMITVLVVSIVCRNYFLARHRNECDDSGAADEDEQNVEMNNRANERVCFMEYLKGERPILPSLLILRTLAETSSKATRTIATTYFGMSYASSLLFHHVLCLFIGSVVAVITFMSCLSVVGVFFFMGSEDGYPTFFFGPNLRVNEQIPSPEL